MAGTCKPSTGLVESSWTVIGGEEDSILWNATTNNGLLNGESSNDWQAPNSWYWHSSVDYFEIQINTQFQIWRAGTTTWVSDHAKLITQQWNGTAYVDISASQPTTTGITELHWELMTAKLPAGKYKFVYNGARIDSEWFIENTFTTYYLFQDGTDIKNFSAGIWSTIGTAPVTETMFTTYGMADLTAIDNTAIQLLVSTSPQLLLDNSSISPQMQLTAIPFNRLVFPIGDIDLLSVSNIDSFTITATESTNGVVLLIVSVDSGVTWQTWNGTSWVVIDSTNLVTVKAGGMTPTVFNALINTDWNTLVGNTGKIRFAYYLEITSSTDIASTDSLAMQVDMLGTWRKSLKGTDFDYEYINNTTIKVYFYTNGDYKIDY